MLIFRDGLASLHTFSGSQIGSRRAWPYRQAGMFVNYLRESDDPAFDRMMNAALDGRPFAEAVTVGYHDDLRSLWQKFIKSRSP